MSRLRDNDFIDQPGGFQSHIRDDHNMWNYLYFMLRLSRTSRAHLNASEQYFADCLAIKGPSSSGYGDYDSTAKAASLNNLSCFPLGKSLALSAAADAQEVRYYFVKDGLG